jgi:hypothetical protein
MDELENAIDSLEMAAHCLETLPEDGKWKWALIAVHQALYGFAVCSIWVTDNRWLTREQDARPPDGLLIDLQKVLALTRDAEWMPLCAPLITTAEEDEAIAIVSSEVHNEFGHVQPQKWELDITTLPAVMSRLLRIVRFLSLESGGPGYEAEAQRRRVESALLRLEAAL